MKLSFSTHILPTVVSAALVAAMAFTLYHWIFQDDLREADAQAAIGPSISKAIELGRTDPWGATNTLTKEVRAIVASLDACESYACERTPAVVRFEEARLKLFHEALDRKSPGALIEAFESGEFNIPPVIAVVASKTPASDQVAVWVDSLLSIADSASGTDESTQALLRTAGKVLESGRNTLRDTTRAREFYTRAWAAGDTKAAGQAARIYHRMGDFDNAYLWSVRCINECNLLAGVDGLSSQAIQRKLSPEAAAQAERLAADPTILEFRRSGAVGTPKASPGA